MNKTHRTVWSESRQAFIVAPEKASARGKSSSTRTVVAQAVTAALLTLWGGEALATDNCTSSTTRISSTTAWGASDLCALGAGDNLVVDSGVTLSKTGSSTIENERPVILIPTANAAGSITNSGTITTSIDDAIRLDAGELGSIINATSDSYIYGNSLGIRMVRTSTLGSISNAGKIEGYSYAIEVKDASIISSGIQNTGTSSSIISDYTAISLNWGSELRGGLSNEGTIEGGRRPALLVQGHSTLSGGIANSGTIRSYSSDRAAITVWSSSSISGGINNSGTISSAWLEGIYVGTNSVITGGLNNSGVIRGATYAVYVDATSTLSDIHIKGNNTAQFVGEVFAKDTAVTVDRGATYTMNAGQVFTLTNSSFTNSGTLAVAAGATGTITGNYAQDSTATFRVNVASDTSYGQLSVSGTAALPSATKIDVNVVGSPTLTVGTTLAGVISAGSLTGADSFSVTDNSVLFNFSAVKNGNDIDLTIEKGLAVREANTRAGNVAGDGAARSLDAVINDAALGASAQWTPIITALGEMSSEAAVANAVSQTLPLLTGDGQVASSSALSGISRVVQARQEANRGLSSGDKFYGDKNFWMKPFGSWADQDDRQGVSGYKAHTSGLAFGVDGTVSDKTRLGGAFAYAKANTTGNSSSAPHSAKVDVYQLVGYGSRALDKDTEVNFQVGLGQNQNRGIRTLDAFGLVAQADYRSLTATAGVGVGRTYKQSETTSFTPTLRADYAWIKDEGYTETGANALNLIVNDRSTEELVLSVDGKLTHALSSGATFSGHLGLGYDALSGQTSITSAFAGAPTTSFTTKGLNPSPWMLRGGVGYTQTMQSGMEVSARYDLEYRDSFLNQTASVKLRWAF